MKLLQKTGLGKLFRELESDLPPVRENARYHSPDVEVRKNADRYTLRARVPGMTREALQVSVRENKLVLEGEYARADNKDELVYSELVDYTHLYRALRIDAAHFNLDKIEAHLKDGVLEVHLPIKPAARARSISVQ